MGRVRKTSEGEGVPHMSALWATPERILTVPRDFKGDHCGGQVVTSGVPTSRAFQVLPPAEAESTQM